MHKEVDGANGKGHVLTPAKSTAATTGFQSAMKQEVDTLEESATENMNRALRMRAPMADLRNLTWPASKPGMNNEGAYREAAERIMRTLGDASFNDIRKGKMARMDAQV